MQAPLFIPELHPRALQQLEVVTATLLIDCANNLAAAYDDLRFLGMPLFLAGVIALLFLFGRSQGLSVASIITNLEAYVAFQQRFPAPAERTRRS